MYFVIFLLSIICAYFLLLPISIKWELDKKISHGSIPLIGTLSAVVTILIYHNIEIGLIYLFLIDGILILTIAAALILYRFYRDPERAPPHKENVILSPADGKIIYIKESKAGEIPTSRKNNQTYSLSDLTQDDKFNKGAFIIGIAMNFLDVHVNRAPIDGRISLINHIRGSFLSLKLKEAVFKNERVFTVVSNSAIEIGIVQIASRLVRRIVSYFHVNDQVARGDRIGIIKFGSQVDVLIPAGNNLKIVAKENTKVKAGLTIIAEYDA